MSEEQKLLLKKLNQLANSFEELKEYCLKNGLPYATQCENLCNSSIELNNQVKSFNRESIESFKKQISDLEIEFINLKKDLNQQN
jgi:hypothetical protein